MASGDDEGSDRPDYKVYRGGSRRGKRSKSAPPQSRGRRASPPASGEEKSGREPGYTVYRSKPGLLSKLRGGNLGSVREKLGERRKSGRRDEVERDRLPGEKPTCRKVLRWALIAAACWFALSVVLFAVSAQIQKGKLADAAGDELGGNPLLAASAQTILVIGTDARPEATGAVEAETRPKCIEQGATGEAPSSDCSGFRADTLMLVRAGGGSFEKLSIPRDTLAEIPGQGAGKINSAYATGGAAAQVQTVEDFMGIDIDHVVLLDFEGFADFIDAIGGVTVENQTPLKSKVDGGSTQGGITLKLDIGKQTLDGDQALAYARTRKNERCDGGEDDRKACNGPENDLDRARRQQEVVQGIKNRLTSPWRAPINFLRGPWIAWNAPKAMVTDMGALTLPQLAIALAIGGSSNTKILGQRGGVPTAAGNIAIPLADCQKAVRKLLGEAGPREPACSPPA